MKIWLKTMRLPIFMILLGFSLTFFLTRLFEDNQSI